MLLNQLSLNIAEPCHENWQEMTPIERGAYCKACCKEVVDFTNMADEDIIEYFEKRKGQQVCGRLKNVQLNKPFVYISPDVLLMDIPLWKKYLAILFICFSGFLIGCGAKESRYENIPLPTASAKLPVITTPAPSIAVGETIQESIKESKKLSKKERNHKGIPIVDESCTYFTFGMVGTTYEQPIFFTGPTLLEKIFGPPGVSKSTPPTFK